jgi:hypothetical protein
VPPQEQRVGDAQQAELYTSHNVRHFPQYKLPVHLGALFKRAGFLAQFAIDTLATQ